MNVSTEDKARLQSLQQAAAEASTWFALLASDDISDDDKARFADWLAASADNRAEFAAINASWQAMAPLENAIMQEYSSQTSGNGKSITAIWHKVWKHPGWASAAAAVACCCVVLLIWPTPDGKPEYYHTKVGEKRLVELPDTTQIYLNTNSAITVSQQDELRKVVLQRGEAFFDVSHDPQRPFIVQAADAEVRVLGTRFNVRLQQEQTAVTLVEGKVALAPAAATNANKSHLYTTMKPGVAVSFDLKSGITNKDNVKLTQLLAWQQGKFVFEATPLTDVVSEINRYIDDELLITHSDLGHLEVTGTFATNRIPELLANLEKALPITVDRKQAGSIRIKPK